MHAGETMHCKPCYNLQHWPLSHWLIKVLCYKEPLTMKYTVWHKNTYFTIWLAWYPYKSSPAALGKSDDNKYLILQQWDICLTLSLNDKYQHDTFHKLAIYPTKYAQVFAVYRFTWITLSVSDKQSFEDIILHLTIAQDWFEVWRIRMGTSWDTYCVLLWQQPLSLRGKPLKTELYN